MDGKPRFQRMDSLLRDLGSGITFRYCNEINFNILFLLHDAMLVQYMLMLCVNLSINPSYASVVSKQLNMYNHTIKPHDSPGTL